MKFLHKAKIACHAGAAAGNLARNDVAHVISNGLQIARLAGPRSVALLLVTCIGSAVIWGLESRYLATFGYLLIVAGWDRLANAALAFHYGLMSFDAAGAFAPVAISNAGLSLAYSAENFQDQVHEYE
jgi:hypothetical protein